MLGNEPTRAIPYRATLIDGNLRAQHDELPSLRVDDYGRSAECCLYKIDHQPRNSDLKSRSKNIKTSCASVYGPTEKRAGAQFEYSLR
jgi:hypothetical protein